MYDEANMMSKVHANTFVTTHCPDTKNVNQYVLVFHAF
jgi:hypothetical protein